MIGSIYGKNYSSFFTVFSDVILKCLCSRVGNCFCYWGNAPIYIMDVLLIDILGERLIISYS